MRKSLIAMISVLIFLFFAPKIVIAGSAKRVPLAEKKRIVEKSIIPKGRKVRHIKSKSTPKKSGKPAPGKTVEPSPTSTTDAAGTINKTEVPKTPEVAKLPESGKPEKKKSNVFLYIGIALALVIILGAIAGRGILIANKKNAGEDTGEDTGKDTDKDRDF
ncbi:MAG: hypothetical protein K8T10_19820 [Candidatus Eremiobacteraeota bacterium]|nr:hypothetical protein [Candidatus Eremiobacteraeota bacterium]